MSEPTNWDLTSVHGLNKFIWAKLQEDLGWNPDNYINTAGIRLVPIIPSQQEPELNALNKPFIVYTYGLANPGVDWWLELDQGTYTIYSADEAEVRRTFHYLRDLLSRYDSSAQDVDDFIRQNGSAQQKKFAYKYIYLLGGNGPLYADEFGGRHAAMITFRIAYTHTRTNTGLRS